MKKHYRKLLLITWLSLAILVYLVGTKAAPAYIVADASLFIVTGAVFFFYSRQQTQFPTDSEILAKETAALGITEDTTRLRVNFRTEFKLCPLNRNTIRQERFGAGEYDLERIHLSDLHPGTTTHEHWWLISGLPTKHGTSETSLKHMLKKGFAEIIPIY